jgi:hypothetical protein
MHGSKPENVTTTGTVECATAIVSLYMAGDVEHAKQIVRRFCKEVPVCVTVSPTTYIYTGGEEVGFVVAFRNYPRFPTTLAALESKASSLANLLRERLAQDSCMIVSPAVTSWSSTRNSPQV